MIVVSTFGVVGFGLRMAQEFGIITINLDPDLKVAECAVLEAALARGEVTTLEFLGAGCQSAKVRKVLVQRVAGVGQPENQER